MTPGIAPSGTWPILGRSAVWTRPGVRRVRGVLEEDGKGQDGERRRRAAELNGRVERFLAWRQDNPAARDQPFFVFINYLEPHLPYNPPEPWRSRFLSPGTDGAAVERLRHFKHPDEVKYVLGLGGLKEGDLNVLSDLYDGEISYIDEKVGELAAFLKARGLLDRTVLVITSDHGEAIGDHGFLDHKMSVFQELLNVPLVVRYRRRSNPASGSRSRSCCRMSTRRSWGWPACRSRTRRTAGIPGSRSSFPASAACAAGAPVGARKGGEAPPAEGPVLVSEFARPIQFLEIIQERFPEVRIVPLDRALVAYRFGTEKLHWASDGRHRLYDLARDPLETTDLAAERPERVRALAAQVESWLRRPAARAPYRLPPPEGRPLAGAAGRSASRLMFARAGKCAPLTRMARLKIAATRCGPPRSLPRFHSVEQADDRAPDLSRMWRSFRIVCRTLVRDRGRRHRRGGPGSEAGGEG